MAKIENKTDWIAFETDQWRDAVQNRGLKLGSLEADQQKLVAEAMSALSTGALKSLGEPFANAPGGAALQKESKDKP